MENRSFVLEDPFNIELNLKRSIEEPSTNNIQVVENNKKRKTSGPGVLSEGFGWEITVYNESLKKKQTFHVSQEVGKKFRYFRVLGEKTSKFCDNSSIKSLVDSDSIQITFETAKIVFQNSTNINGLFRKLNQQNFVTVLITLDYLGFLPMVGNEQELDHMREKEEFDVDLFWLSLARKLSCFDWFNCEDLTASTNLRRGVLQLSIKLQNGFRLLYELVQHQFMKDIVMSLEGGNIIREIFKHKSEIYGIRIVNQICGSLGAQWSPDTSRIEDFLRGITEEDDVFDAISFIWQPTLWYLSECKSISQFAQSSPHAVSGEFGSFPIELELYADQDHEGSATTVNFSMETPPPNPDASITSVTSLGIFAYPKVRCTGLFGCFAARAKFYFGRIFLGEATFDLTSDGIKAFCPIISGGPNKTGLLVTCRIDEFIERNKEELQNILSENQKELNSSENFRILQPSVFSSASIDQIAISDLTVDVKVRFFPLRTLSLYLLYKRSLGTDTKFITNFALSLQQDVAEWLGTYLTCVWIQISKQRDSLFIDKKNSVLPLSANSLRSQRNLLSDSHKLSEVNTPNPSTRYSSNSSSDSRDVLAFLENERFGNDNNSNSGRRVHPRTSNNMRFELINEIDSAEALFKEIPTISSHSESFSSNSSDLRYNSNSSTCYIDPVSPGISPFPLISAWFRGVGRPSDTWCIHNILSEVLSDDLIARHFTDVLTMIQTCESWVDAESLANIRQQFIHFMNNNKLDSIGALLFDWIRHVPRSRSFE